MLLSKALCNEAGFVMSNGAIWMKLGLVSPIASKYGCVGGSGGERPGFLVLERIVLSLHNSLPMGKNSSLFESGWSVDWTDGG